MHRLFNDSGEGSTTCPAPVLANLVLGRVSKKNK